MCFMDNTDRFLELYRQLEREGRRAYFPNAQDKEAIMGRLMSVPELRMYKDDIDYCRVVRNFLVHTPKVKNQYPIFVSNEMLQLMEEIVDRVKNPIKAIDYAIKIENMYTAQLNSNIIDVVRHMQASGFTHVPVLENGKLIGVFSGNVIYTYLSTADDINLNFNSKICDLIEYLPVYNHTNEYFAFMSADSSFHDIRQLFKIDAKSMKQLAAVFLTQTGKNNEKLLAMLTPYSILRDAPDL